MNKHKVELTKKFGLDNIEGKFFELKKVKSKIKSPIGYPDSYNVIGGVVELINDRFDIWLLVQNHKDWFRTSPIVNVMKEGSRYIIETKNSIYELS